MQQQDFDPQFQAITKAMVEIAFEYVDFNKEEVDVVYVFGSIEDNTFAYNLFYNINGQVVRNMLIHTASAVLKSDSDKLSPLMGLGNAELKKMEKLFKLYERDVPTLIKLVYLPKTNSFTCNLSYDLQYSYDEERYYPDVLAEWFDEIKGAS